MHNSTDVYDGELELEGPADGGWYHTRLADWIALNPEVNHPEFRLYCIMRSLCLEKRAPIRRVSVTELAQLMPGVNNKQPGRSTVENLLKRLRQHRLVEQLDAPSSGGPARWRIHDWPQPADTYAGWRNTFDKLDAIRGLVDNSGEPVGQHPPQKQGGSGRGAQKTKGGAQKTKGGPQKTGSSTGSVQEQPAPQEPLPEGLLQPPEGAGQETIHNHPHGSDAATPAETVVVSTAERAEADRMIRALAKAHNTSVPAQGQLYDDLVGLYATARRGGHTWEMLWRHLRTDLPADTRSVAALYRWRLQHLPEVTVETTHPSEPCGQCDGRRGEPAATRVMWLDATTTRPCHNCHPHGIAEAHRHAS